MQLQSFMDKNPTEITLFITGKCNFHCAFCGYKDTYSYPDINVSDLDILLECLQQRIDTTNECFYFNLMGGEPTINKTLLANVMDKLKTFRAKNSSNIKILLTSNGVFAMRDANFELVESLSFDCIIISCSEDHFNQGNAGYIYKLLERNPSTFIQFNIVNKESIYNQYISVMEKSSSVKQKFLGTPYFLSSKCINITNDDELLTYCKKYPDIYNVVYKPFGLFILGQTIYTACAGNGTLPWCKLSDTLEDTLQALDKIKDMYLNIKQPCSKECMLTCRHLQEKGYTCFDKKSLELLADDKVTLKEMTQNP